MAIAKQFDYTLQINIIYIFIDISLFQHILNIFIECIHNVNNFLYIIFFHALKNSEHNFMKHDPCIS